ncbi:hypothetical protein COW94_02425 [Candidatus Peregrinibacteria bacterium CG22_combo_CG10-13_8_21_14_all_44_10]|nr:MAG: hypothetical protein AUK45_02140 [Candidatus Peregrinibacteria bacterium CG2_30_44_17]PIP66319.1 MAG: hypothetical protein COW94_02425 [Candidatus Peregrinibacteria bacterium CG22_combo_CG10-13_8_21_14_all_44_10]PIS04016.1 MAG: hypothetical protein COT83_02950 [Candidatus Peregrinibacteria bacterium CG10_big_fil_rev_8_21_14_0_10_44_7]PIX79234.1 MAG: hypothetical protein COZ35_03740 [Candidatus Peregrinibacteria bacterium CG_4_10_14_3_um_filter_44_21]PJB88439.1 MAG: hypothetical protein 
MKAFYLAGSIIMSAVILILAFENIQASCNYITFFFWEVSSGTTPTMTIFFEAILGIITGFFYTQLLNSWGSSSSDEEEEDY